MIATLGAPTNATLGATQVHTATVTDDDAAPTIVATFKAIGDGPSDNIAGDTVTFTYTIDTGVWSCESTLPAEIQPKSCVAP